MADLHLTKIEALQEELLNWYLTNPRSYSWRCNPTPYHAMIAEFMLQRTRADQVAPVYNIFLSKYPDLNSLANADVSELNEILKPLGLHKRSVNFKKASEYIINEFNSTIPDDMEMLLRIPGVGDYVGGAILAIAFSKSSSIVDSNIARLLNRFFGLNLKGEIRRKAEIKTLSCELFNHTRPREILFAVIDFGAKICTPRNPKHKECPLRHACVYYNSLDI